MSIVVAGPAIESTIVDQVAVATDASGKDIRAHIEAFVADLVARRLLE